MWNVGGWGWLSSLVHSEHTGLILCLYEWLFNHKPSISQYFPKLQSIFHKTEYSIPFTCMYKHLINVKWINPEDRASEKSWTMQPLHLLFYDMSVPTYMFFCLHFLSNVFFYPFTRPLGMIHAPLCFTKQITITHSSNRSRSCSLSQKVFLHHHFTIPFLVTHDVKPTSWNDT